MADFDEYVGNSVPTTVSHVSLMLRSEFVGAVETEFIEGTAVVVDQFGNVIKIHNAPDYQYLLDKNVVTVQQLQDLQILLREIRANVEAILLP